MNEAVLKSESKSGQKIKILIADDHPLMCLAIRNIFEEYPDFEVIAEATDGEKAVRLAKELVPDLVILDISMPKLNGLEATRQMKMNCPYMLVLVLTVHNDIEHIFGIFEAGADGYLTKSALGEEVVQSVRGLVSGEAVLSPDIFKKILKHALRYPIKSVPLNKIENLSAREQQILLLTAKGMSNKEIAVRLNLSQSTVKTYLVDIFAKMGVSSRTEAVISGIKSGIIVLDDST